MTRSDRQSIQTQIDEKRGKLNQLDWEERQEKQRKEIQFWKHNPEIFYTEKQVNEKISVKFPKRFINADMSSIDPQIWELVEGFLTGDSLYLWGLPGIGKTHLCFALIKEYFRKVPKRIRWYKEEEHAEYETPPTPHIMTVPDLLAKIKASFGRKEAEIYGGEPQGDLSESQIIEKVQQYKILFLDDLGTEKTTEWALQTIYSIIDYRYREMLQTVITSNLSLNNLSDRTSDRITSRIAEMCKVIELKGKDRRVK